MRKVVFLISFVLLFFVASVDVHASLVTVDKTGAVVWKVLGEESLALSPAQRGNIEVTNSATGEADLILKKEGDKVFLNNLDVTSWGDSLIEVEERGDIQKIFVSSRDGKFVVEQNGVVAMTDLPINIRPQQNEFSVTGSAGSVFLSVLPLEAAESALRSKFISYVDKTNLELAEKETGILVYQITGEKGFDVFNLFEYKVPVKLAVSASTGEILSVEGPEWFKIFGFLFG